MSDMSKNLRTTNLCTGALLAAIAGLTASSVSAQQETPPADRADITVTGQAEAPAVDPNLTKSFAPGLKGPEIKGIISARSGDRVQITTLDGARTIIAINDATKIKVGRGLFSSGRKTPAADALLNGVPITVKTLQPGNGQAGADLVASQINLRGTDLKTAHMIRNGTAQGFAEQTAATEALRGRMGDIDQYNIKGTTNVNFDTGKAVLSAQDQAKLCATTAAAESTKNALLLVVGYTDSTGGDELNQALSEKRASRVVNYIQQACGWKPYRMLTPTGMAKADPLADNSTPQGKAQNRRVAVNILVSKGLDGL